MPARKTEAAPQPKPSSDADPGQPMEDQTPTRAQERRRDTARSAPDPVYVAALLRERAGYARYDLADRVAAVDAELKTIGAPPADDA